MAQIWFCLWAACMLCIRASLQDAGDSSPSSSSANEACVASSSQSCMAQPQHGIAMMQRRKQESIYGATAFGHGPGVRAGSLLLSEAETLVKSKGGTGIGPTEMGHIEATKDLITNTILPSILEGLDEHQQEVDELYQAVVDCKAHSSANLNATAELQAEVETHRQFHKTCRETEDVLRKDKLEKCQELETASLSITLPDGKFPSKDVEDTVMLRYLKTMDEYFCGRWEVFKETIEKCEDAEKNYTQTHGQCMELQQDFEETYCTWKTELESSCSHFETCWTSAINRYFKRKDEIEKFHEERLTEYDAALRAKCLWDAWDFDHQPCTVNETQAKRCYEQKPNMSATITFYPLPKPPSCDVSVVAAHHPCTSEFVATEYASLHVSRELVEEIKEACTACPASFQVSTPSPQERTRLSLTNIQAGPGHTYIKNAGGQSACDGVIQSLNGTVKSIQVTALEMSAKITVEMFSVDATHSLMMEDEVASGGSGNTLYLSGDKLSMVLDVSSSPTVFFKKNDVKFATESATGLNSTSSFGRVKVCTLGASLQVDFTFFD